MRSGTVYTETVVHAAAERFASEAPFQVAIVGLEDGGRITARVTGERVAIGDRVIEVQPAIPSSDQAPHFRKS